MEFNELKDFITLRMRMQHIYQPVMIKTLLKAGGKASVRTIAKTFLQHESQIEYYEQITRNMPGKVLVKHGIVRYDSGNYLLNVTELTEEQQTELINLCNNAISNYKKERGMRIWQHRVKDQKVIPGSMRYEVLKAAKFRCHLCGISADEKALEVDHIIPRNKGGKTVLENLQAPCYTCNSQKLDRDSTDFRAWMDLYENRDHKCPFCNIHQSRIMNQNMLAYGFLDKYPVVKDHTLVCPKRHVTSFFELVPAEHSACLQLLDILKTRIIQRDQRVTGFNIGVNVGEDAGQTVSHCHIHLIPRRKGDVDNPTGGVRNIINRR
ncbi:MAG: HIT domain-containing protein [Nitrososphaerales archaeon]